MGDGGSQLVWEHAEAAAGRYRAWYIRGGKRYTPGRTFPLKIGADDWLGAEDRRLASGERPGRPSASKTLKVFVEEIWLPSKVHLAERTKNEYEAVITKWIYEPVRRSKREPLLLGDMPIAQIDEGDVLAWYSDRKEWDHLARFAKAYRVFREIMRYAEERRAVPRNPFVLNSHRPST